MRQNPATMLFRSNRHAASRVLELLRCHSDGEALVQHGPVRVDKVKHAVVIAKHFAEEVFGLAQALRL